jgi:hypothetical protein
MALIRQVVVLLQDLPRILIANLQGFDLLLTTSTRTWWRESMVSIGPQMSLFCFNMAEKIL